MHARKERIYSYHDGSGNTYEIADEDIATVEYFPVKPKTSSSGFYDGGNYTKKEITKSQLKKIKTLFNKAKENIESHLKDRIKSSGMITIPKKESMETYILSPDSLEKIDLEKILKEIL